MIESRCGILCDECEYREKAGYPSVWFSETVFSAKSVVET